MKIIVWISSFFFVWTKKENDKLSLVSFSIHTVIFNTEPKDTFMTYISVEPHQSSSGSGPRPTF